MKKKLIIAILGLGWMLLALFLMSGYFFNQISGTDDAYPFNPIAWDSHIQMFNGALQCKLIGEELSERKKILQKEIFSNVERRNETSNGVIYYFNDDSILLETVLEHILIEKTCCPFFKFDVSILPFNYGFALQISGPEAALDLIKEYELEIN